jgi:hypothetical protein
MTRLRLALAAAATLAIMAQTATAKADPPPSPPPAASNAATAVAIVEKAATTSTSASVGTVMVVLDVLGLVEKGAPKGAARVHAAVRTPTWLQPEPPKTPIFYSSLVVAKF